MAHEITPFKPARRPLAIKLVEPAAGPLLPLPALEVQFYTGVDFAQIIAAIPDLA